MSLKNLAGAGGFEPPNAGIKNLCLNRLTTPQGAVNRTVKICAHKGPIRGKDEKASHNEKCIVKKPISFL